MISFVAVFFSPSLFARALNLKYEGYYSLEVACQNGDSSQGCSGLRQEFQMNIVEDGSKAFLSILGKKDGKIYYFFESEAIQNLGETITGKIVKVQGASPPPAEVSVTLAGGIPSINGWIRDPLYKFDLKLTGKQNLSAYSVLPKKPDFELFPAALVGDYTGKVPTEHGILHLRTTSEGKGLVGIWVDETNSSRVDFPISEILEKEATVVLNTKASRFPGVYQTWILGYSDSGPSGAIILKGLGLSSFFLQPLSLEFTRK